LLLRAFGLPRSAYAPHCRQMDTAVSVSRISGSVYSIQRRLRRPWLTWVFRLLSISIQPQMILRSRRQDQDYSLWSREAGKRRAHCRFLPLAKSRYLAKLRNSLQEWPMSLLFVRFRSREDVGPDCGACFPAMWNLRRLPCRACRWCRRSIRPAQRHFPGRMRKVPTAEQNQAIACCGASPAIRRCGHPSSKGPTNLLPAPFARRRRKPMR
jgi:hypothetical protein